MNSQTEKTIGNYKIKFKTFFKLEESELITLSFSITDDLKELLKKATISETTEEIWNSNGEEEAEYLRYKVKKPFFNDLYSYKELLFAVKLLDEGKFEIEVENFNVVDNIISYTKDNLKKVIEKIERYMNVETTVTFNKY